MAASHIRKFFSEGTQPDGMIYPKVTIQEIKEFKEADPKGYDEVSEACANFYGESNIKE